MIFRFSVVAFSWEVVSFSVMLCSGPRVSCFRQDPVEPRVQGGAGHQGSGVRLRGGVNRT